jgi:Rha family phage regulatory protein
MTNEPKLEISHGEIYASSLRLAEDFDKNHFHVLRTIDGLVSESKNGLAKDPDAEILRIFFVMNFHEVTLNDRQGKPRRAFKLTRDGFDLIAMSFTGPKATLWKIRYIYAFRRAEIELRKRKERERTLTQLNLDPSLVREQELTIAEVLEQLALFGLFSARTTASSLKTQIKRGDLDGRFDGRHWVIPYSSLRKLISKKQLTN